MDRTDRTTDRRNEADFEALRRALAESKLEVATQSETVARLLKELAASRLAVSARNDFLAMVAHDLRSPLTVITLNAGVLLKMMTTLESGRPARKLVQRVQSSADLMSHFISDLLDVASSEAGHLSFKPTACAIAELLEEARDTLAALAEEKGLLLGLDVRVAPATRVLCDRPRFLQLVSNLVGNAIKFTSRGGRITIGAKDQDTHVFFWVKDTGVGIPTRELPHLFDQYWKGKRLSDDGFGLGLAIVRNLVESQGGTVSVESAPDKGSTFAFTLPRAP